MIAPIVEIAPPDDRATEYEEGLFGACVLEPHLFAQFGRIGREFGDYWLGRAYDRLHDAHGEGKPVHEFGVWHAELRDMDVLSHVGVERLGRILTDTPGSAHAAYYCSEIKRAFECRRFHKLSKDISDLADRGETKLIADLLRERSETISGQESAAATITVPSLAILHEVMGKLQRGEGDVVFDAGPVFADFEVGPGLLTGLAGVPGGGKTAFAVQYTFSVLHRHPELRAVIANAETGFDRLLKRELTRLSGVPSRALRFADLTPGQLDAVEQAAATLEPLLSRVDVFEPPYSLERIEQLQDAPPGLLLLDYLQKFSPPDKEPRIGANAVATTLRHLCHAGWGVLALSATARTKGKNGASSHSSANLSMASMKESGEIEFNCDLVYLLRDQGPVNPHDPAEEHVRNVQLDCVKSRHGAAIPTDVIFDKPRLEFRLPESTASAGDFDDWDAGSAEDDPFGGPA